MMTETAPLYGELIEPTTLRIERLLPGPIERVSAYLTESDLRRQWLAAGVMQPKPGTPFELVWRNGELSDPPSAPPEGFAAERRMECRIVTFDAPRKLVFDWPGVGEVTIDLATKGAKVLLTLTHRRLPDRKTMISVAAGWHAHLDVLVLRADGKMPSDYWASWQRLHQYYDAHLPA